MDNVELGGERWMELAKILANIQAEFADDVGALETAEMFGVSNAENAASSVLRSALRARQEKTAASLYASAGLLDEAGRVAADVDPALSEETLAKNGGHRALWKNVAKVGVAVAERSGGRLYVHDVLDRMPQFDAAEDHIKAAVARELRDHRRVADMADKQAKLAVQSCASLRADVERVRKWRATRPKGALRSCGCKVVDGAAACPRCGGHVIDELDGPFDDPLLDLPV